MVQLTGYEVDGQVYWDDEGVIAVTPRAAKSLASLFKDLHHLLRRRS